MASEYKLKDVFAAFTRGKGYWETAMNITRLLRKAMYDYKEEKQQGIEIKFLQWLAESKMLKRIGRSS